MFKRIRKHSSSVAFARQNSDIITLLLLIMMAMLMIGGSQTAMIYRLRALAERVTGVMAGVLNEPVSLVRTMGDIVYDHIAVYQENQQLKQENQELLALKQNYLDSIAQLQAMKELINAPTWQNEKVNNFIVGRIIGDIGGVNRSEWMVNIGADDGLKNTAIAYNHLGLVGLAYQVNDKNSKILRLNDINSHVPVTVAHKNIRAIAHGLGTPLAELLYLDGTDSLAVGDEIITSGQGGLYRPFMPIGVVKSTGASTNSPNSKPLVVLYNEQNPPILVKLVNQ